MKTPRDAGPASAAPVAAIILTYNEEANLEACLRSVAGWCRQVFVVDSGSMDGTARVSRLYTDLFFSHPYVDHPSQWQWALANLPLACNWVIPLDADYVVSPELQHAIKLAVSGAGPPANGYYAAHRAYFRGRRMRGFKPYSLCLFRRQFTQVEHGALTDHRFVVEGKTAKLSGTIEEVNRKETLIDFWIDKHQRYAARMAAEEVLRAAGRLNWLTTPRLFGNPHERIVWFKIRWNGLPLYVRPFLYFFYRYVLRLGFLDGSTGFVYHFMQALWFRLLVDVNIADLRRQIASGATSPEQLLQSFNRDAR